MAHSDDRLGGTPRARLSAAAGCGGAFFVLLIAFFGYVGWSNALPPLEPDTRVLPNPNGYDAVLAAVLKLKTVSAPSSQRPWSSSPAALRRELPRARPVLDELRTGLRQPYLTPARDPRQVPQFAAYRSAARHLAAEAALALAEGKPAEAMDRSLDTIELGVSVERGASYGMSLLGAAVMAIGQNAAERCVDHLSAAEARVADRRLDQIMGELPEPGDVAAEDRRETLLWMRDVCAGREPLPDSPAAQGNTPTAGDLWKDRVRLFVYPKSWSYRRADRHLRSIEAELRKPYPARQEPPVPTDGLFGEIWLPFSEVSFGLTRTRATLQLLRCRLALHEYQLRHGAAPDRLEALVPETIPTVPVDPFSAQPLRYRLTKGEGVAYSVGPDQRDDGGRALPMQSVDPLAKGDLVAGKLYPYPQKPR
jgi:hypothetical protein